MSYSVIPTPRFKKEAKRLLKRFGSLQNELRELEKSLQINPRQGVDLGNNAYKLRLTIKSKGKGKSGGARIITFIVTEDKEVYLLRIYDKSEKESVSDALVKQMIAEIKNRDI